MTEYIGWGSSIILLLTILMQVRKQWSTRSNEGVSRWLFAGQCASSVGFTVYSFLVWSPVFIVTNTLLLISNLIGIALYLRNGKE